MIRFYLVPRRKSNVMGFEDIYWFTFNLSFFHIKYFDMFGIRHNFRFLFELRSGASILAQPG